MKNEFVPYEEALALKKLGFDLDGSGLGFYCWRYDKLNKPEYRAWGKWEWDTCGNTGHWLQTQMEAPLYQQAFRWFFETHNLFVEFMFDDMTWQGRIGEFTVPDFCADECIGLDESEGFKDAKDGYINIQNVCLRKLIEIVKNK